MLPAAWLRLTWFVSKGLASSRIGPAGAAAHRCSVPLRRTTLPSPRPASLLPCASLLLASLLVGTYFTRARARSPALLLLSVRTPWLVH